MHNATEAAAATVPQTSLLNVPFGLAGAGLYVIEAASANPQIITFTARGSVTHDELVAAVEDVLGN